MAWLEYQYLGAAALYLKDQNGTSVLIDPYLEHNSQFKPSDFDNLDLLLVTHGAFDHLGQALEIMRQSSAVLIAGYEVCEHLKHEGIEASRLLTTIYGDKREYRGFIIRTVAALHASIMTLNGNKITGWPFGYIVRSAEDIVLYHAGDTSLFSDMRLIGELYHPDIVLIGVDKIQEPYPLEMTPHEAALAASWIRPNAVIPAHYPKGSEGPQEFAASLKLLAPEIEITPLQNVVYRYEKYRITRKKSD